LLRKKHSGGESSTNKRGGTPKKTQGGEASSKENLQKFLILSAAAIRYEQRYSLMAGLLGQRKGPPEGDSRGGERTGILLYHSRGVVIWDATDAKATF